MLNVKLLHLNIHYSQYGFSTLLLKSLEKIQLSLRRMGMLTESFKCGCSQSSDFVGMKTIILIGERFLSYSFWII